MRRRPKKAIQKDDCSTRRAELQAMLKTLREGTPAYVDRCIENARSLVPSAHANVDVEEIRQKVTGRLMRDIENIEAQVDKAKYLTARNWKVLKGMVDDINVTITSPIPTIPLEEKTDK